MLLVVGAVIAVFLVVVPDQFTAGTRSAACALFGGDNCDQQPGDPGDGTDPPGGTDPDDGTGPTAGADPDSPEQQAYDKAKKEADDAQREYDQALKDMEGLKKELLEFLKDLIGITDAMKCFQEGDIMACIETAANAIPWSKAFKVLRKLPKAFKLARKFKKIWDKVADARKKRDDAKDALDKAAEKLRKKKEADRKRREGDKPDVTCKRRSGPNYRRMVPVGHGVASGGYRLTLFELYCQPPEEINNKTDEALKSPNPATQLEGKVADRLRRSNCAPTQFQQPYKAGGGYEGGDVDAGVPGALIEIYNGSADRMADHKGHQPRKLKNHPDLNPDGKRQVIFFMPNVSTEERLRFQEQYKDQGIRVFGSLDHMVNHLRRTGAC